MPLSSNYHGVSRLKPLRKGLSPMLPFPEAGWNDGRERGPGEASFKKRSPRMP